MRAPRYRPLVWLLGTFSIAAVIACMLILHQGARGSRSPLMVLQAMTPALAAYLACLGGRAAAEQRHWPAAGYALLVMVSAVAVSFMVMYAAAGSAVVHFVAGTPSWGSFCILFGLFLLPALLNSALLWRLARTTCS